VTSNRCFFFDEHGEFIEGLLHRRPAGRGVPGQAPRGKIIHDPRLTWNTIDLVRQHGGTPVLSKTATLSSKADARRGCGLRREMSAHHYFRDFAYCDSGMIPGCW